MKTTTIARTTREPRGALQETPMTSQRKELLLEQLRVLVQRFSSETPKERLEAQKNILKLYKENKDIQEALISLLFEALESKNSWVRINAAAAIRRTRNPSTRERLEEHLKTEKHSEVRTEIQMALDYFKLEEEKGKPPHV